MVRHRQLVIQLLFELAPAAHAEQAGGPRRTELSGGYGGGETPLPIPNRAVKPSSADGTARETVWESRSPPGVNEKAPWETTGPFFCVIVPRKRLLSEADLATAAPTHLADAAVARGSGVAIATFVDSASGIPLSARTTLNKSPVR